MRWHQHAIVKSYISQYGEDLLKESINKEQVLLSEQFGNLMLLNVQDALMKLRNGLKTKK